MHNMTKLIFLSFVIVYSRNGRGVKPNLAAFLNYSSEVWGGGTGTMSETGTAVEGHT
jgi:hypothetical protein